MKKLLTFLLCVLLMGAVGLTACGSFIDSTQKTVSNIDTDKPVAGLAVQGVSAPKLGATITRFGAGNNNEQVSVSKTISATVEPSTALNKFVDYRVFWAAGAERENENVSDYVIVEQDSDGSVNATVTCFQGFGDDVIVVQVVTREGGYTAECNVTYVGLLTEMSVTSSTLNTVNTQERGDYYELYTNNTYTFTVDMDNDLHDVKNYDLSVTAGGVGEFYFFDKVVYEEYGARGSFSPAGWYPEKMPVGNMLKGPNLYSLNDIVDKFFEVVLNNNVVTVTVKDKELSNYYEAVSETYREFVYDTYGINYYSGRTPSESLENEQNLPSAYFTVTVTDANTNIASTVKLWVVSSVNGVSLSAGNLEF